MESQIIKKIVVVDYGGFLVSRDLMVYGDFMVQQKRDRPQLLATLVAVHYLYNFHIY